MWKGDACLAVEAPRSVVVDGSPDPQLGPKVEETTWEVGIETLSAVVGRLFLLLLLAAMSLCSKGERASMVTLQLGKVLDDDDPLQVRMAVFVLN